MRIRKHYSLIREGRRRSGFTGRGVRKGWDVKACLPAITVAALSSLFPFSLQIVIFLLKIGSFLDRRWGSDGAKSRAEEWSVSFQSGNGLNRGRFHASVGRRRRKKREKLAPLHSSFRGKSWKACSFTGFAYGKLSRFRDFMWFFLGGGSLSWRNLGQFVRLQLYFSWLNGGLSCCLKWWVSSAEDEFFVAATEFAVSSVRALGRENWLWLRPEIKCRYWCDSLKSRYLSREFGKSWGGLEVTCPSLLDRSRVLVWLREISPTRIRLFQS